MYRNYQLDQSPLMNYDVD